MARLVVLTEGLTGRSVELTAERTTIGRVEDNTFQLAEPSVSSHHCEVLFQSGQVMVKDLNSTNGTFIEGDQVTAEAPLKPGQVLRLGKIELRLEDGGGAPSSPAKQADKTIMMPRGVKLNELEQGTRAGGFDTVGKGFSKKDNKANKVFLYVGIAVFVVIVVVLLFVLSQIGAQSPRR